MSDNVSHPKHYTSHPSGVECIQITEHMSFTLGNAFKYIWRSGLKADADAVEDLEKAIWYLQREIAKRKKPTPEEMRDSQRGEEFCPRCGAKAQKDMIWGRQMCPRCCRYL